MYALALGLGLGCGLGCGSLSTPFLTSYIVGNDLNVKNGFASVLVFSIGKIFSMIVLGLLVSLLATNFINEETTLLGMKITLLFDIAMAGFGVVIIKNAYTKIKSGKCSCSSKSECNSGELMFDEIKHDMKMEGKKSSIKDYVILGSAGILYGLTPCLPLITILGIASTLNVFNAVLLTGFFGIITCLSPVISNTVIAGLINNSMRREIKDASSYIHILAGLFLFVFAFLPYI